ncbi:MAG: metal-dependent hydrolase [Dehalococcoidia bacterium]
MSWAAHDLEPYAMQRHLGRRVAIIPLIIGSYAPDLSTKWFVYGINLFGLEFKADNPAQFHRGWPGAGFTHSLAFGVVIGLLLLLLTRKPIWGFSFMVGQWAHALTDTGDTVGTMLLFPFTTHHFSVGAWAYAGQTGRFNDAGAYFSGLGFVWDGVWVVLATMNWQVLTRSYFEEMVLPADPVWSWAQGTLPLAAVLALYRASYFYGVTRWMAWIIWAHVVNSYQFDLTWGGPNWVPALTASLPPVRAGPGRMAFLCPCGSCC